jgi:hypothetical protein
MLCGISIAFNSLGDVLGLVSCQCGSEHRQVLVGFQSTEALGRFQHAGGRPAQRITALRHRFTLRLTRRTVPIMFSIALVQASERRSGVGSLRRTTVSISSSPSRMLAATPGASWSSRRARLRSSRSGADLVEGRCIGSG